MLKCYECGHIFEDGEREVYEERHGFNDGLYEERSCCPMCGGDYGETERCERCGGEYLPDELEQGFCEECRHEIVDEYCLNTDKVIEAFEEVEDTVCINAVYKHFFTEETINKILFHELKKYSEYFSINWRQFLEKGDNTEILLEWYRNYGEV